MIYPTQAGAKARVADENSSFPIEFSESFDPVTLDTDVTDGTLGWMTACNIRNIDQSLLRRMKARAAEDGLTLRDWAIQAFVEKLDRPASRAVDLGSDSARTKNRRPAGVPVASPAPVVANGSSVPVADPKTQPALCEHGYTACVICKFGLPKGYSGK